MGVFQDRLVVELRLSGARTLADANRVLATFLPGYNRRFTVPPREQMSAVASRRWRINSTASCV